MTTFLDNYKVTRNFTYGEFRCPHCRRNRTEVGLIEKLQEARNYSNLLGDDVPRRISYHINSGWRCSTHNARVGGTPHSKHLVGKAADIHTPDGIMRMCVLYGLIKAGFTRIGIYPTWIHADISPGVTMWRE